MRDEPTPVHRLQYGWPMLFLLRPPVPVVGVERLVKWLEGPMWCLVRYVYLMCTGTRQCEWRLCGCECSTVGVLWTAESVYIVCCAVRDPPMTFIVNPRLYQPVVARTWSAILGWCERYAPRL